MSLAISVVSSSKSNKMGFDDNDNEAVEKTSVNEETKRISEKGQDEETTVEESTGMTRTMSESSICATEDDEDDEAKKIELGPQFTLKEQLEKDKVFFFFNLNFLSLLYLLHCFNVSCSLLSLSRKCLSVFSFWFMCW